MPYSSTPPLVATKQTFGVHVVVDDDGTGKAVCDGTRNGEAVERWTVPAYAFGATCWTGLVTFAGSAFHVDRIEWWDEPGGTLLQADDFTSLAAWSPRGGFDWSISPAGYAYSPGSDFGGTGDHMVTPNPPGARYVECQGCYTDAPANIHWVMIEFNCGEFPGPLFAPTGIRCLLRPSGAQELPDRVAETKLGRWTIGVGIG